MLTIRQVKEKLRNELPKVKGIQDKKTGKTYLKGENLYYDMQIENYIICPDGINNWFNFIKADYELLYN